MRLIIERATYLTPKNIKKYFYMIFDSVVFMKYGSKFYRNDKSSIIFWGFNAKIGLVLDIESYFRKTAGFFTSVIVTYLYLNVLIYEIIKIVYSLTYFTDTES